MTTRRLVRATEAFFDHLDDQLGSERGSNGEPSATDFLVFDFPNVVEQFATNFDRLPEVVQGVSASRMLLTSGLLVRAMVVYGLLLDDESIDLIGIELDT